LDLGSEEEYRAGLQAHTDSYYLSDPIAADYTHNFGLAKSAASDNCFEDI